MKFDGKLGVGLKKWVGDSVSSRHDNHRNNHRGARGESLGDVV